MKYSLVRMVICVTCLAVTATGYGEPRQPGADPASQELKNPQEASEQSLKQGAALYKQYCVTCHAVDGSGKTDMAGTLQVPPASFQDSEWKYGATDGEIFSVIRDGGQNGMQGFAAKMPEARIWNIVNYLRTFANSEGGDAAATLAEVPTNPIETSQESIALGKQLYARSCIVCHGANGKGDTEMREFLPTHPSDLTDADWNYGGRDGDIFLVIKNGTEYDMEAFADRMTDERIWHVVNYVKSLGGAGE